MKNLWQLKKQRPKPLCCNAFRKSIFATLSHVAASVISLAATFFKVTARAHSAAAPLLVLANSISLRPAIRRTSAPFRCSSSPHRNRFAGFQWGPLYLPAALGSRSGPPRMLYWKKKRKELIQCGKRKAVVGVASCINPPTTPGRTIGRSSGIRTTRTG